MAPPTPGQKQTSLSPNREAPHKRGTDKTHKKGQPEKKPHLTPSVSREVCSAPFAVPQPDASCVQTLTRFAQKPLHFAQAQTFERYTMQPSLQSRSVLDLPHTLLRFADQRAFWRRPYLPLPLLQHQGCQQGRRHAPPFRVQRDRKPCELPPFPSFLRVSPQRQCLTCNASA